MTDFEYNTRAFRSLALPEEQRGMLESLVRAHPEDLQFDDLVKGKGRGLIFLLHGEPGVGKTLTAGTYLLAFVHVNGNANTRFRKSE
jgi:DNA polymerase III delta prime subunit